MEKEQVSAGSPRRPEGTAGQKVGFAMVVGLVMIVVSTSTAIYTGYLLWRGDPGTEVLNTLPSGCEVLILSQDVSELKRVLNLQSTVAQGPAPLAQALTPVMTTLRAAVDSLEPALRRGAGAGLCLWAPQDKPHGWLLTLGVDEQGSESALTKVQAICARQVGLSGGRWTASEAIGDFVQYNLLDNEGHARAAVLRGPTRLVATWALAGADATQLLTAAVKASQKTPLRDDMVARAALERVGGGGVQVAWRPSALSAWMPRLLTDTPLEGLFDTDPSFLGLSVALRGEPLALHLHAHFGVGPKGVRLLKSQLDPMEGLRATQWVPANSPVGGVLRANPSSLARSSKRWAEAPVWSQLVRALGQGDIARGAERLRALASAVTGHVLTKSCAKARLCFAVQLRAGGVTQVEGLLRRWANPSLRLGDAWLFVGGPDRPWTRAPGQGFSEERARLLDQHQGLWVDLTSSANPLGRGPLQLESLWLDTGVVAHLTLPVTP